MICSDKIGVSIILELLKSRGINKVVLSPGSRNAPFLFAFANDEYFDKYIVVDERSAAFFALGLSLASNEIIAIVCTSGTAILNNSPAIAEAYYRNKPIIVISSDRPLEWIDQDEGQTIRQDKIIANVVKDSISLMGDFVDENYKWYVNRNINEILNIADIHPRGPVHINMSFKEPLYGTKDIINREYRVIDNAEVLRTLSQEYLKKLSDDFNSSQKIMIVCGFHDIDEELSYILNKMSGLSNVVILCESISNLKLNNSIQTVDRLLLRMDREKQQDFAADIVISFGGSLISRLLKSFIRRFPPKYHWAIDARTKAADVFSCMTNVINMCPKDFFYELYKNSINTISEYSDKWKELDVKADIIHNKFLENLPWSDFKVFKTILEHLPQDIALHIGNSTPVRYVQLFKHKYYFGGEWSNRGVNGIEGSLSTAIGFSNVYNGLNFILIGDVSFMYDSNALWNKYANDNIRIILIRNGGGGIFKFIKGPDNLEDVNSYFTTPIDVDINKLCDAYGIEYFKAENDEELTSSLSELIRGRNRKKLLEVFTDKDISGELLRTYFKNK